MTHAGLFSGIGGFNFAADRGMNWHHVFDCEIDPFCQKVLKYYWPNAIQYGNIEQTDFSVHRGTIDVLSGGFPCQPYSLAGKRAGTNDARHLWPQMLRAIQEIKPRWVVGENVRGLLSWNEGMVFNDVQTDLENSGYEVFPILLPAASVGAYHERYRIWFVAHANSHQCNTGQDIGKQQGQTSTTRHSAQDAVNSDGKRCKQFDATKQSIKQKFVGRGYNETTTDTDGFGWIQGNGNAETEYTTQGIPNWKHFPTQPPVCSRIDGFPTGLVGLTFSSYRRKSIEAAGNAVVPQVVLQLFKAIQDMEDNYL